MPWLNAIVLAAVVSAIIASSIISRLGMLAWPFLNDSGLYAALGRAVANGDVLYRDLYETKLPGAALLASAFWRAFGPHWAGYVVCQSILTFIAAAALALAAHRGGQSRSSTFLYAVVFLNLSQGVYTGFQLETIQAFFEALAAMAAVQSLLKDDSTATFTVGLAAATAAMAKPGGLGVAAAFAIALLITNRRRSIQLLILLAGLAVPTGITLIYTVRSGAWPYLPAVISDIQNYAAGTPVHADAIVKVLAVLAVLGFPFLFRGRKTSSRSPLLLFGLLWFVMDLVAALIQRRLYPYHFLPLACPAALLFGQRQRGAQPLAIGLFPIALLSLTWQGSRISLWRNAFLHSPTSDFIAAHTTANDSVFADQIGRLLIEADRTPGSRMGTFFYLVNSDQAPGQYMRILLSDFEARKPKYLILKDGWDRAVPQLADCDILSQCPHRREKFITAWAALREYVHLHYHPEAKMDGVLIYRR